MSATTAAVAVENNFKKLFVDISRPYRDSLVVKELKVQDLVSAFQSSSNSSIKSNCSSSSSSSSNASLLVKLKYASLTGNNYRSIEEQFNLNSPPRNKKYADNYFADLSPDFRECGSHAIGTVVKTIGGSSSSNAAAQNLPAVGDLVYCYNFHTGTWSDYFICKAPYAIPINRFVKYRSCEEIFEMPYIYRAYEIYEMMKAKVQNLKSILCFGSLSKIPFYLAQFAKIDKVFTLFVTSDKSRYYCNNFYTKVFKDDAKINFYQLQRTLKCPQVYNQTFSTLFNTTAFEEKPNELKKYLKPESPIFNLYGNITNNYEEFEQICLNNNKFRFLTEGSFYKVTGLMRQHNLAMPDFEEYCLDYVPILMKSHLFSNAAKTFILAPFDCN